MDICLLNDLFTCMLDSSFLIDHWSMEVVFSSNVNICFSFIKMHTNNTAEKL